MSGSFRPKIPRRTDRHHSIEIVGQNAESDPDIGPIPTPQATAAPLALATARADRRFSSTRPATRLPHQKLLAPNFAPTLEATGVSPAWTGGSGCSGSSDQQVSLPRRSVCPLPAQKTEKLRDLLINAGGLERAEPAAPGP
jgi:hypothetical protein